MLATGTAAVGAAEIYQWTDSEGQVHFTDRPPPGAHASRLEPHGGAAPDAAQRLEETLARIEREIEALRDLRAAQLGVSRDTLDRHEGRGDTAQGASPLAGPPDEAAGTRSGAIPGAAPEDPIERMVPGRWRYGFYYPPYYPGVRVFPQTSDAFRPPLPGRAKDGGRSQERGSRPSRGGSERAPARGPVGGCCGPNTPVPE